MATTYKKLSSYLLSRGPSVGGSGYYYGDDNTSVPLPESFNTIKTDIEFKSGSPVFGYAKPTSQIFAIAVQADGKSIVQINEGLRRLRSDAKIDDTFNGTNFNSPIKALTIQPDGKVLVGGNFSNPYQVGSSNFVRVNPNGLQDTTFIPSVNGAVNSIALQPDGKIIIGGSFTSVNSVTRNRIARLNADGTLDTGFNPNAGGSVESIALQSDGKIIVGGFFTNIGGVTRFRIARLNADGTLDPSLSASAEGAVLAIALQPDGKIIIGGSFNLAGNIPQARLARFNKNGELDINFSPNVNGTVNSITLQSDGKILIGGNFTTVNNLSRPYLARLKEVVNNAPYRLAYRVPENTQVIVKNIFATNHNNFPVFHDIAILPLVDENSPISEKHYYVWDDLIDSNEYKEIESVITLSAGDEIYVYSATDEEISYNIFGVEIAD